MTISGRLFCSPEFVISCIHYVDQKVLVWNSSDIDHTLVEGKLLYKSPNTINLLSVDELLRLLTLYCFSV